MKQQLCLILYAYAFMVNVACSIDSQDVSEDEEELASGGYLSAYGMNYGGLKLTEYRMERLHKTHMGLVRAWWNAEVDVNNPPKFVCDSNALEQSLPKVICSIEKM